MAIIRVENASQVRENRNILKNVNLSIEKGDVLAFIGPTGSGKTTLLRILSLVDRPASGSIYFNDVDVTLSKNLLPVRRRISYVHQKPVVFSTNVFNNIAFALKWRKYDSAAVKSQTENILELIGMADYRRRDARTLSGGETQRVAIARALVTGPEVLFLDEPTANLDPISVTKIEEILIHTISAGKTTVVMTTHDMLQGQRLASRIGVLISGELLQVGKPADIFTTPAGKKVADFVGVDNVLAGIIVEKDDNLSVLRLDAGKQILVLSECAVGERAYAVSRPEDVTFSVTEEKTSARNVFPGIITRATLVGPLVRIEVDCGFPLLGLVTRKSAEELNLTVGRQVYASIKATAVCGIRAH